MKRKMAFLLIAAMSLSTAAAQTMVIGEKVPDLKVREWVVMDKPMADPHRMMLVEFFHPSNAESAGRLAELDRLAKTYPAGLTVAVITKDDSDQARTMLRDASSRYHAGIDDAGRTFAAFGVQYVPYAVLVDPKGKLLWLGNPATMDGSIIESNLENGVYQDRSLRKAPQGGKH